MANRTITQSAVQFNVDVDLAHQIVHGSNTVVVQTEGGPVSSFSKIIGDVQNALNGAVIQIIQNGVLTAALNSANVANAAANSASISANIAVSAASFSQNVATQFGNLSSAISQATTQANISQFYANASAQSANSAAISAASISSLLSFSPGANKVPQADGSGQIPPTWVAGALVSTNNLSDLGNVQLAKQHLMVGTLADQNADTVIITGGSIDATTIGGTTPAAGSFTNINVTGSVTGANVVATNYFYGNIQTAAQPLITSVGTLSNLVVTGTGTFGSLVSTSSIVGNLVTPVQANITALGTLTALQVNGYSDFFQRATFVVQTQDSTHGAVEISGNGDGSFQTPYNTGVMLQNTGQPGIVSRVYIDGQDNYPVIAGRRYNGNTAQPAPVNAGDIMFRIAATPYTSGAWPQTTNISSPRMDFISSEPQQLTSLGSRIEFWVNPIGANTVSKIVTIDSGSGVTATRFTGPVVGDIVGNVNGLVQASSQPFITTVGNLTSLAVAGAISNAGGIYLPTVLKITNYTVTINDYTVRCDATGGAFTVTLPLSPGLGQIVNIKKVDTSGNNIIISGNGKNIDGNGSASLTTAYSKLTIQYNGTNWDVL